MNDRLLYKDAIRGARNKLKRAKLEYKKSPTIEKDREVVRIRKRLSVYGATLNQMRE